MITPTNRCWHSPSSEIKLLCTRNIVICRAAYSRATADFEHEEFESIIGMRIVSGPHIFRHNCHTLEPNNIPLLGQKIEENCSPFNPISRKTIRARFWNTSPSIQAEIFSCTIKDRMTLEILFLTDSGMTWCMQVEYLKSIRKNHLIDSQENLKIEVGPNDLRNDARNLRGIHCSGIEITPDYFDDRASRFCPFCLMD